MLNFPGRKGADQVDAADRSSRDVSPRYDRVKIGEFTVKAQSTGQPRIQKIFYHRGTKDTERTSSREKNASPPGKVPGARLLETSQ